MSTKKALVLSGETIKTFNSDNLWETTSLTKDTLTDDDFINKGFDPDILNTSLTSINLNFIDNGALGDDGEHLWISQDIDKNLGVTGMGYIDDDVTPKLQLTIPAFLPKDSLSSTDKILIYSADSSYLPTITSTSFSANSTHNQNINLTVVPEYLYSKKVVYRVTIGSTVSSWSSAQSPNDSYVLSISPGSLTIGSNTVKVDIADANDSSKISTTTLENAISLADEQPSISIIQNESNAFQVHFIVTDPDNGDLGSYQLTLSNSKGVKVLVPWTPLQSMPIDVKYQWDSSDIAVKDTNILKIEFKDNYGSSSSTSYTFTGEYKNILFVDENGNFYTTDKGVLLKLLDLGKVIGGRSSDIKKVSVQNNNPYKVSSITVKKTDTSGIPGTHIEFSKVLNPFTPLEDLDYGDQELSYKEKVDFYVRLRTEDTAQGIDRFNINAFALPVVES